MDNSKLDQKYFIDDEVFNCPYCNRNNVKYTINKCYTYDFTESKEATVFFVTCDSCNKESMHSSFDIKFNNHDFGNYYTIHKDYLDDIDSHIFHSQPNSFFALDNRIPKLLRELVAESEGCLKMNFLTGASACSRKAIYEFLLKEKACGNNYDDKLKDIKKKFCDVDDVYFEILGHIKDMTSEKVHEQSWDKWNSTNIKVILETLKSIFVEIYVVPTQRIERKKILQELKDKIIKK